MSKVNLLWLAAALNIFASCGKKDSELPLPNEPSFATFHIRGVGVPSDLTQSPHLISADIIISGCSHSADNRILSIKKISKNHLENLTKLSTGCVASLASLTSPGDNGPEVYRPDQGNGPMPIVAGNTARYVCESGREIMAIAEVGLSNSLQAFENVSLAFLPPQKENRLPLGATVTDFGGTSPLPDLVPTAISFEGVIGGKNAYSFYLECGDKKLGDTCGDFKLSDLKIRFVDIPPIPQDKAVLMSLVNERGPQIVPNESNHYWNGIRINVATTAGKNSDAAFLVLLGDSLRLFTFKLP